jgi:GNAT superfamily N-acetyltransferase
MAHDPRIESLSALGEPEIRALADVLIDCVEGGASVSFMLPMTRAKAEDYWRGVGAALERRECLLMAAFDAAGTITGTVQVLLRQPENQPHRADIAKMLVHRRARRRGVGALLLHAAEAAAVRAGKSLLVLDTASADAGRLYERVGWQLVGEIPDYALWPQGGLVATKVFYKRIGAAAAAAREPSER